MLQTLLARPLLFSESLLESDAKITYTQSAWTHAAIYKLAQKLGKCSGSLPLRNGGAEMVGGSRISQADHVLFHLAEAILRAHLPLADSG